MIRFAPKLKQAMTRRENHAAAFMKAAMAPLDKLNPAMIESIAACHARRGSPDFAKLLASLSGQVAERQMREAQG